MSKAQEGSGAFLTCPVQKCFETLQGYT
jgi:hypothetical protein